MKYTDEDLKAWRDSIEPASHYGDCLYFENGEYQKVDLSCRCFDGTANISFYDEPGCMNVSMERLFPLDYLDGAEQEEDMPDG